MNMNKLDDLRKQLDDCTKRGQSLKVMTGIEKLRGKYLKEKTGRLHQILQQQEDRMNNNNETLEMMCHGENKLIEMVDDMNGPYGQTFQLDLIQSLWNKKTVNDEQFLENREQDMKMYDKYVMTLPKAKQVKELKQQSEQNEVKLTELNKELEKKEKICKQLKAKLAYRQKLSDTFVESRKKMLAELQETNRNLEAMWDGQRNTSRTSSDSRDKELEKVQEQKVEQTIPIVEPVKPSTVANNEPKRLKKMLLPNIHLDDMVFSTRTKQAMHINPDNQNEPLKMMGNNTIAPNQSPNIRIPNEHVRLDQERMMVPLGSLPVTSADYQRQSQPQQSKRKCTDGLMDSSKSTKQPKTRHPEEMLDDNDDQRKPLAGGNKENVIQHGERQQEMRAVGSSSAQDDRHGLMAPIQRSPKENIDSVYDNRLAAKNDKQCDGLQFSSATDASLRSNMVQPIPQRSTAFVAYGSQQKLPPSYSSSVSSKDRSKMLQQIGRVSGKNLLQQTGQNATSGDGRKSSSRCDDEATLRCNLAGRSNRERASLDNRSTVTQQTGRKSDPNMFRQNQYANENYGRNNAMPGDGRKSSNSRDKEATMPYSGQKPKMRESISPAKQRSDHGNAGASMYDNRQQQQSEIRREMTQSSFSRDEKMDGQRDRNKPKEHHSALNAPSKHQIECESSGDDKSATSNRRNHTSVDNNYGMENRQSGRKSDSSLGSFPKQRKSKVNSGDEDDMQRHHGNTSKTPSGSGGPIEPEFLVPKTKPSEMKQKVEKKRMEQSKSAAQDSPAPSVISSVRTPLSYVPSEGTDFGNIEDFDDDLDNFDLNSNFGNPSAYSYQTSENYSEQMRTNSKSGDKSADDFGDWPDFSKVVHSPLSDFADFETGEQDEIPEGFEDH